MHGAVWWTGSGDDALEMEASLDLAVETISPWTGNGSMDAATRFSNTNAA